MTYTTDPSPPPTSSESSAPTVRSPPAAVEALLRRGARVRALVRRSHPGRDERVDWVLGDLGRPGVLRSALDGLRTVLYVSPHADEEVAMAELVVAECRRAGVRLVFVGVHVSGRTVQGRLLRAVFKALLPAYRPKLDIGRSVETTSPEVVMLVPSNFYDNDLPFLPDISTRARRASPRCSRIPASLIGPPWRSGSSPSERRSTSTWRTRRVETLPLVQRVDDGSGVRRLGAGDRAAWLSDADDPSGAALGNAPAATADAAAPMQASAGPVIGLLHRLLRTGFERRERKAFRYSDVLLPD